MRVCLLACLLAYLVPHTQPSLSAHIHTYQPGVRDITLKEYPETAQYRPRISDPVDAEDSSGLTQPMVLRLPQHLAGVPHIQYEDQSLVFPGHLLGLEVRGEGGGGRCGGTRHSRSERGGVGACWLDPSSCVRIHSARHAFVIHGSYLSTLVSYDANVAAGLHATPSTPPALSSRPPSTPGHTTHARLCDGHHLPLHARAYVCRMYAHTTCDPRDAALRQRASNFGRRTANLINCGTTGDPVVDAQHLHE